MFFLFLVMSHRLELTLSWTQGVIRGPASNIYGVGFDYLFLRFESPVDNTSVTLDTQIHLTVWDIE